MVVENGTTSTTGGGSSASSSSEWRGTASASATSFASPTSRSGSNRLPVSMSTRAPAALKNSITAQLIQEQHFGTSTISAASSGSKSKISAASSKDSDPRQLQPRGQHDMNSSWNDFLYERTLVCLNLEISCVALAPCGTFFVVGNGSGDVKVYDMEAYAETHTLKTSASSCAPKSILCTSKEVGNRSVTEHLIVLSGDGIRVFSVQNDFAFVHCIQPPFSKMLDTQNVHEKSANSRPGSKERVEEQERSTWQCVAFHPRSATSVRTQRKDNTIVACADMALVVYSTIDWGGATSTPRILRSVLSWGPPTSCVFTPAGTRLIVGHASGSITVWNSHTFAMEKTLSGHQGAVTSFDFYRDEIMEEIDLVATRSESETEPMATGSETETDCSVSSRSPNKNGRRTTRAALANNSQTDLLGDNTIRSRTDEAGKKKKNTALVRKKRTLLVSCSRDKSMRLWSNLQDEDAAGWQLLTTVPLEPGVHSPKIFQDTASSNFSALNTGPASTNFHAGSYYANTAPNGKNGAGGATSTASTGLSTSGGQFFTSSWCLCVAPRLLVWRLKTVISTTASRGTISGDNYSIVFEPFQRLKSTGMDTPQVAAFSPDGNRVIVGSNDGVLGVFIRKKQLFAEHTRDYDHESLAFEQKKKIREVVKCILERDLRANAALAASAELTKSRGLNGIELLQKQFQNSHLSGRALKEMSLLQQQQLNPYLNSSSGAAAELATRLSKLLPAPEMKFLDHAHARIVTASSCLQLLEQIHKAVLRKEEGDRQKAFEEETEREEKKKQSLVGEQLMALPKDGNGSSYYYMSGGSSASGGQVVMCTQSGSPRSLFRGIAIQPEGETLPEFIFEHEFTTKCKFAAERIETLGLPFLKQLWKEKGWTFPESSAMNGGIATSNGGATSSSSSSSSSTSSVSGDREDATNLVNVTEQSILSLRRRGAESPSLFKLLAATGDGLKGVPEEVRAKITGIEYGELFKDFFLKALLLHEFGHLEEEEDDELDAGSSTVLKNAALGGGSRKNTRAVTSAMGAQGQLLGDNNYDRSVMWGSGSSTPSSKEQMASAGGLQSASGSQSTTPVVRRSKNYYTPKYNEKMRSVGSEVDGSADAFASSMKVNTQSSTQLLNSSTSSGSSTLVDHISSSAATSFHTNNTNAGRVGVQSVQQPQRSIGGAPQLHIGGSLQSMVDSSSPSKLQQGTPPPGVISYDVDDPFARLLRRGRGQSSAAVIGGASTPSCTPSRGINQSFNFSEGSHVVIKTRPGSRGQPGSRGTTTHPSFAGLHGGALSGLSTSSTDSSSSALVNRTQSSQASSNNLVQQEASAVSGGSAGAGSDQAVVGNSILISSGRETPASSSTQQQAAQAPSQADPYASPVRKAPTAVSSSQKANPILSDSLSKMMDDHLQQNHNQQANTSGNARTTPLSKTPKAFFSGSPSKRGTMSYIGNQVVGGGATPVAPSEKNSSTAGASNIVEVPETRSVTLSQAISLRRGSSVPNLAAQAFVTPEKQGGRGMMLSTMGGSSQTPSAAGGVRGGATPASTRRHPGFASGVRTGATPSARTTTTAGHLTATAGKTKLVLADL
ncbi:unnamed protein product [Amoebophrya sp. A25]|nr:unnamed protein product [Amoebophrya sp. A25]|eukprot:GSA25T00006517001.1